MPIDIPPDLEEQIASWFKADTEAQEESVRQPSHTDEAYVARIVKILIWLAGVGSCFVLAWWGSGELRLFSTITVIFPLLAWHIFGLWTWMLLLPISLLGLLALQGAVMLW
jgi:hypothetical protein